MAYTVLGSLTQTIDQIPKHEKYPLSNYGKQIDSLRKQVVFLQKFLEEYPKEASRLETRIREATNEAEDVIEHFMYEEIKLTRSAAAGAATEIVYDFRELKMVMNDINSIANEAEGIKKKIVKIPGLPAVQSVPSSSSTPAAPTVDSVTVGLEEDLKKIVGLVCDASTERKIIPITGMGGIGKTTLAKKVYNDKQVIAKFEVRAWVTVSQDHKPENIFAELLYLLKQVVEDRVLESNDSNEDKLYKILTQRKFLIVLDDVWNGKAWDDIKKAFGNSGDRRGSRIIITTRDENVGTHVQTSEDVLHKMQLLNKDQSWELLEKKVFQSKKCPFSLEKMGWDIATNCGGLPLAIVLVAGILSNIAQTPDLWKKIAEDVHSAVDEKDEEFTKIISLSYTHLPLYLRPCFLYMGGFPEDYEMRLSKLIKLWIEEGFVRDEAEAGTFMANLISRNLSHVTAMKSNGKVKSCNIHDMVRDLCKRKALDENYERRMSNAHPDLTRLARAYASTLRSLISFQPNEVSLASVRKFKLLRVLDVVDTDAYSLPATVFDLFHLRYLAFGCPMEIPTAISKLQNLRALIIRPSKRLRKYSTDEVNLPLEIWMMPLLTHLVSFFDLLPHPEAEASPLEHLLTLSVVKKLVCTKEMMDMIPNLRKLAITYFGDKLKHQEDYQLYNLVFLDQLEKLTLVVKEGSVVRLKDKPVFPKSLRKLTLSGWRFPWKDMKVVGSLPKLQVLKLRDHACEGGTWEMNEESDEENDEEISEGQFPTLEYLLIETCDLEKWVIEEGDFPKLKRLHLHRCSELREIPNDIGDISTLTLIEVDRTNIPLVECVKRIHKEQIEEKCNKFLQVQAL